MGLGGGQGLHILPDLRGILRRQDLCQCLGHAQFPPHIAGEVFIGGDKGKLVQIDKRPWDTVRVLRTANIPENHAGQFLFQLFFCLAGKLCHVGHIHFGFLRDGNRQGLGRGIHMVHGPVGADGPFCEHIRLAFQPPVLVDYLQGAQKVIAVVTGKYLLVTPVIDEAKFSGERIIELIQLSLLFPDGAVRNVLLRLKVDQLPNAVPQLHHANNTIFGSAIQVLLFHDGIFTEIHIPVYNSKGEILHIGVSGDGNALLFGPFLQLRRLGLPVLAPYVLDGIAKLVGQLQTLYGFHSKFLSGVLGAFSALPSQNHLWMADKIAVYGKAVLILPNVYPVGQFHLGRIPFLKKQNVRYNICPGIGPESVVGQADSAQKVRPFRQIFSGILTFCVHGVPAGDKGRNTSGAYLVQHFGGEIVMDTEMVFVVGSVRNRIISERHVAHGEVIKIPAVGGFKSGHSDIGFRVKLLGNASGDAVQLHAVQLGRSHSLRQKSEEISHTAGRFQDVASGEAHITHSLVDCLDNHGAGVVGIED